MLAASRAGCLLGSSTAPLRRQSRVLSVSTGAACARPAPLRVCWATVHRSTHAVRARPWEGKPVCWAPQHCACTTTGSRCSAGSAARWAGAQRSVQAARLRHDLRDILSHQRRGLPVLGVDVRRHQLHAAPSHAHQPGTLDAVRRASQSAGACIGSGRYSSERAGTGGRARLAERL